MTGGLAVFLVLRGRLQQVIKSRVEVEAECAVLQERIQGRDLQLSELRAVLANHAGEIERLKNQYIEGDKKSIGTGNKAAGRAQGDSRKTGSFGGGAAAAN